jgi:enoyl-[acyl-carrier-protein] reductase (NADH)
VRARGADGFTVAADVTKEEELRRIFSQVQAEFGALNVLVSNARPRPIGVLSITARVNVGSWQPWAAMGAAKPGLKTSARYFAVALGARVSP